MNHGYFLIPDEREEFLRDLQYVAGAISVAAFAGAAELAAWGIAAEGALLAKGAPMLTAVVSGTVIAAQNPAVQSELQVAQQEVQAFTPAVQAEANVMTSRLDWFNNLANPIAARMRTFGIFRTNIGDFVGTSTTTNLPKVFRPELYDFEYAASARGGVHAEQALIWSVNNLTRIFGQGVLPRILVVDRDFCSGFCTPLIKAAGGLIVNPRTAVWPSR